MTAPSHLADAASEEPLAGVNVLDLTIAWAGPMATRILASLGATVVKLENPLKLDSWRGYEGSPRERFPDEEPGPAWYNRNAWFNTQNHDKLSLCINLKAPAAQLVKQRALAWADVVIANFAPGALDRLGLGFDAAVAVNPDIVVVEMPAFGNDGPLSHHVGMGQTMEAAAGMASLMGYDGGHPSLTGTAFLDPAGGLHGAAAALTALYLRELTGEPQYVEVPQVEAALHWIGPEILSRELGAEPAPPAGNEVEFAAPHDAYRCAGDDEWVAIEVRDQQDWSALCAVIGRPDLDRDGELASLAGRRRGAGVIRAAIEAWSTQFTKEGAARQLQRGGVIAAPVSTGADIATDPHLWARGFFTALDHPDCGRHFYPGVAVRAGVMPRPLRRAAPQLGTDNGTVLELFGLSPDEAADLERQGVTMTRPAADWRVRQPERQPLGR
jgi:crotonobetainyl-CoA:carnitine CoA-transferase CaiB-like acyl-CoA transferase